MAKLIKTEDGSFRVVFNTDDVIDAVEDHLGKDAADMLREELERPDEQEEADEGLERKLKEQTEHYMKVFRELRKQSGMIARLIRQREIDRVALSVAAGKIGRITWEEIKRGR